MSESQEELHVGVCASYHQFFLAPVGADVIYDTTNASQLLCISDDGRSLIVLTGCADGPVRVTVRSLETAPPREPLESWEEVERATMHVSGPLRLSSPTWAESFDDINVKRSKSDLHEVRCYARGRGASRDIAASQTAEEYLLEIWPR